MEIFSNIPTIFLIKRMDEEIPNLHPSRKIEGRVIHSGGTYQSKKTGRNDHCPCGSWKKFKKCCLK